MSCGFPCLCLVQKLLKQCIDRLLFLSPSPVLWVSICISRMQNLVKRDKDGYKEEFLQQQRNYLSELEIFKLKVSRGPGTYRRKSIERKSTYDRDASSGADRPPGSSISARKLLRHE